MNKYVVRMYDNEEMARFIDDFNSVSGCAADKKSKSGEWVEVELSIDHKKISRGAGRHRKDMTKSVGEVYRYRYNDDGTRRHTAAETAEWLGISLRTYQRYVKSLMAYGMWSKNTRDIFEMQLL